MTERGAPGLRDDWFSGWLAAIGATVLVDGLTLRWSDDRRARAIFSIEGDNDLIPLVAAALPSVDQLGMMVIANRDRAFPHSVSADRYAAAALLSRKHQSDFSLSSSLTDLADPQRDIAHGKFDIAAPRGQTLWDRLAACVAKVEAAAGTGLSAVQHVEATMDGRARRVGANGLGFDVRRIEAGDPPSAGKFVDPIIEILGFYGLALFPVRGDGRRESTRGWRHVHAGPESERGARRSRGRWFDTFRWASWRHPLDRWAIDALLAELYTMREASRRANQRLDAFGVRHVYEAVPFRKTGDMDMTAGFASRRADG